MKFTKEEACKDLMSQIPTKGETLQLSERSINEQLETLMPLLANDETELADFIVSVLPVFRTADANVRANVSGQVKDYKEKNPVTPIVKKEDEKPAEDDAMAKALARIEELERKNAEKLDYDREQRGKRRGETRDALATNKALNAQSADDFVSSLH
jgi:hypothetical protein